MSINSINSGNTFNYASQQAIAQNSERIASGSKINSAADNAAGLAITDRLNRQISGFSQSIRNVNDGISLTQTAGGALGSVTEGIQRIRELSLQAANGVITDEDRQIINAEAQQIKEEIEKTLGNTTFNGKPLLSGGNDISVQSGPQPEDQTTLSTQDFTRLLDESGFSKLDLSTANGAQQALSSADELQTYVDSEQAILGAVTNRFESTINTLTTNEINAEASRSRIEDADMAKEISELAQNDVKNKATIALQVQANQSKQSVLSLLEGIS